MCISVPTLNKKNTCKNRDIVSKKCIQSRANREKPLLYFHCVIRPVVVPLYIYRYNTIPNRLRVHESFIFQNGSINFILLQSRNKSICVLFLLPSNNFIRIKVRIHMFTYTYIGHTYTHTHTSTPTQTHAHTRPPVRPPLNTNSPCFLLLSFFFVFLVRPNSISIFAYFFYLFPVYFPRSLNKKKTATTTQSYSHRLPILYYMVNVTAQTYFYLNKKMSRYATPHTHTHTQRK